MTKESLKKILKKGQQLEKTGNLGLAREFIELNTKVDTVTEKADKIAENVNTKLAEISDELKKKLEEELSYEIDPESIRGEKGNIGEQGEKGDKGDTGATGKQGRNPMFIGKLPPLNPQKGDLWTKI